MLELLLEDCQPQGLGIGLLQLEVLPILLQVQQFCVGNWYLLGWTGTIFEVGSCDNISLTKTTWLTSPIVATYTSLPAASFRSQKFSLPW